MSIPSHESQRHWKLSKVPVGSAFKIFRVVTSKVVWERTDKPKTAMTTPFGLFEFNRMPFGLTNAPATFQRLMERCLTGLNLKICLAYLDDVIVFARTFEEMLERLEAVLKRLGGHDLKLKPSKCKLFQTKLTYLGHVVSKDGVEPDPEKISALPKWLENPPKTRRELQAFLGFAGYYRNFDEEFATIAAPLHQMIRQPKTNDTSRKTKPSAFQWTEACQRAFESLITKLSESPVLAFPDFSLPFTLHTDASGVGLGTVLYQMQDGKQRVLAYASRSLNHSDSTILCLSPRVPRTEMGYHREVSIVFVWAEVPRHHRQ